MDGEAIQVQQGDLIWLYPDQRHILINQSKDIEAWIVVIRPDVAQSLAQSLPGAEDLRASSRPTHSLCRRWKARPIGRPAAMP